MGVLLHILPAIVLQSETPGANTNITMLEDSVLIPAICIIMMVVIVAGIVITSQKHKRY